MEIVFATKNQGKLREIRKLMEDSPFHVISMQEAGIEKDVSEDGSTFEENAEKKAAEIMNICGKIVMADDSGLEIDYLNKEPGVYSARYLGTDMPYTEKNKIILERMAKAEGKQRSARFVCAAAAVIPPWIKADRHLIIKRAVIEGLIHGKAEGENGFGYDPIFYVPEYQMTTAQMDLELKNRISHRAKAISSVRDVLEEVFKDWSSGESVSAAREV